MPRKPAPDSRERILDTASRLFYENGVHAVGVQQVIDECGCGKNLLYREFPSKDDLLLAYLERSRLEWEAKFSAVTQRHAGDSAGQLLALVRQAVEDAADPNYHGCAFSKSIAEYPEESHPVRKVVTQQRIAMMDSIRQIATEGGAIKADELAARIVLIMDGISSNAAVLGAEGSARFAVTFAEDVVRDGFAPLS